MKQNADTLITALAPEIDRKCEEIRTARRERKGAVLFTILCAMTVLIPTLLVLSGVSAAALIAPIVFMSICVILLLPILLSGRGSDVGGGAYGTGL